MRMDDAIHIRPGPVEPAVEAIGRVRHALALEHLEVLIDHQQVRSADLVKPKAQALRIIGARYFGTCGDLPGQA
ncbi:hypothetical protein D3C76_1254960 [compost metagenome]